ncbi:MAG: hypothetical protein R8G33_03960 [Gammaproteobacteria bacterium]|nr:hypothetical protein [Gammaproteobacteria bacterium]
MTAKNITIANPQGKASLAVFSDLQSFAPVNVHKKDIPRWLADFFTSLLVLSAKFSFKPITNREYYLYLDGSHWKLSLIEPDAWKNCPYIYFASCCLHEDKSWSISPLDQWEKNDLLLNRINEIKQEFYNTLNSDESVHSLLPYYESTLNYYQRLAANGLAKSLKQSLDLQLGLKISETTCGKQLINQTKFNKQSLLYSTN